MSKRETKKKNLQKKESLHLKCSRRIFTSRKEKELEDCGNSVHKNWCGACVKARCTKKHLQVEPLEKRGRKRTESSWVSFDCILLSNADTTLEYENEPSPEVFQEVTIYSCVEVVVRITYDIPLLNWIPHFARRFMNKMRTGCGWKESIAAIWRRGADIVCETHVSRSVCLPL